MERLGRTPAREGVLVLYRSFGYETEKVTVGKFGREEG
jgi:hypothetical protein